jgi:hypothetical protein
MLNGLSLSPKAANFLKHADRDVDEHLPIDKVENEKLLMVGCAAYLHLMRVPTPEIMACYAFWATKNDAVDEVGSEARGLGPHALSVLQYLYKEDRRYRQGEGGGEGEHIGGHVSLRADGVLRGSIQARA